MSRTATKSVALTVAAGVLTFGVQQLTAGATTTGLVGIAVGLALFGGYQLAENRDHAAAYDEVVGAVGEDTIKRLAEMSADELDRIIEDHRNDGG